MNGRGEDRMRWLLAAGAGLLAAVTMVALVRVPEAGTPAVPADNSGGMAPVGLARLGGESADEGLLEEAMLRDPAPLFLPSEWSASGEVLRADAWRDPQTSFRDYPAKLKFSETRLNLELPSTVAVPGRAGEAFGLERAARPFAGFGQSGAEVAALPERRAFLEVVSAGDGQRVISQPLANAEPPGEVAWQPLAFLVAVDVRGVMGAPVLTESSRVAAVDSYFRDYVVKVLHLGERLEPGFYLVGIGP
jgi:hypothetical protein